MTDTPDGVDLDRLQPFFAANVANATGAPLQATLIAGGRSNLTYSITDGTSTWVLRRPPLGHVLPTAHDMAREYRVMSALAPTNVPVPRTLALCEDLAVNDAPFYVMELVDGTIYRDGNALATLDAAEARRASEALVDVLAAIHAVDYRAVGLEDFGRPDGFLERQVRRWGEQWERSKTRELPAVDELARRLRNALPESGPPTIVHGDYRLDNTMMASDDPGKIIAVLDWEMSTLGDPLTDLGLFLLYWGQADAQIIATGAAIGSQDGFLSRDDIVARYASVSGRAVDQLDWYVILASYKLAIIVEGINARYQMGKTLGEGFETMGAMVSGLIDNALEQANRSEIVALRG
ncbi:MAG: phosphotransferase family protein [Acidimicrobiia bacterium]|nr:phosphotransferase family protein [Acidimicrobiia bacterium]